MLYQIYYWNEEQRFNFQLVIRALAFTTNNYTTRYKRNRTICARLAPKSIMMMTKTKNSYKRITIHTTRWWWPSGWWWLWWWSSWWRWWRSRWRWRWRWRWWWRKQNTVKPVLSGPPIKRTPSCVPKRTSDISLYNEPLSSGHLYWEDADTKISCIWLISIVKHLY